MKIKRIISGGQTGADRAALDVAIALGYDYGGWIPKGRLAEDGPIPVIYASLEECNSEDPEVRTGLNVLDSAATLILSNGKLTGGSDFTQKIAVKSGKPIKHLNLKERTINEAVNAIIAWLSTIPGGVLNIAGPRHSEDPEIYEQVKAVLLKVFKARENKGT